MNERPDEPQHGREFAPLESTPPVDPYAPVDYPTDEVPPSGGGYPPQAYPPPAYPPPAGYLPPGGYPPPPQFPQPGHPQPGYLQGGYPPPGQPYGYPPYDPYGAQQAGPGTNGKAIGSLVSSLVGLLLCTCLFVPSIVGIVLGIIALGETKRTGQQGRGLALAGVIIGAVSIVLGLIVCAFIMLTPDTSSSNDYVF